MCYENTTIYITPKVFSVYTESRCLLSYIPVCSFLIGKGANVDNMLVPIIYVGASSLTSLDISYWWSSGLQLPLFDRLDVSLFL